MGTEHLSSYERPRMSLMFAGLLLIPLGILFGVYLLIVLGLTIELLGVIWTFNVLAATVRSGLSSSKEQVTKTPPNFR